MSKRDYKNAEARASDARFSVYLDEMALRTPAQAPLLLPSLALAQAIAAEWQAQTETIKPDTMVFMRFAATAIDRITPNPAPPIKEFVGIGKMDLLAFRATRPDVLVEKQTALWNPPLAWAAQAYGINLPTTTELTAPPPLAAKITKALTQAATTANPFRLAGLAYGAGVLGSAVLSLALMDGNMDAAGVYEAAFLDDHFQTQHWGADEEAQARLDKIRLEIETLAVYSASIREV